MEWVFCTMAASPHPGPGQLPSWVGAGRGSHQRAVEDLSLPSRRSGDKAPPLSYSGDLLCPKVIIPAFVSCFVFILSLKLFDKLRSRFSLVLLIVFRRNQGMDIKAVYCHPADLTFMQSTSCKMPGWMKQKLESRLLGEVSITSDMQMIPPLWQKAKRN